MIQCRRILLTHLLLTYIVSNYNYDVLFNYMNIHKKVGITHCQGLHEIAWCQDLYYKLLKAIVAGLGRHFVCIQV